MKARRTTSCFVPTHGVGSILLGPGGSPPQRAMARYRPRSEMRVYWADARMQFKSPFAEHSAQHRLKTPTH